MRPALETARIVSSHLNLFPRKQCPPSSKNSLWNVGSLSWSKEMSKLWWKLRLFQADRCIWYTRSFFGFPSRRQASHDGIRGMGPFSHACSDSARAVRVCVGTVLAMRETIRLQSLGGLLGAGAIRRNWAVTVNLLLCRFKPGGANGPSWSSRLRVSLTEPWPLAFRPLFCATLRNTF